MDTDKIILLVQVGRQLIPIIETGVSEIRSILAGKDVDPAVFDKIDAAYDARIAEADREAQEK